MRREFLLDADHFLRVSVGEFERLDEVLFGNFMSRAFDHDDVVFRADVNEIEIALVALVVGRIRDELAIHSPDAHGADRTGERNVGNSQRGGGAVDRENVGIILTIRAQEHRDDLGVVKIARGKERTQRAIRHARGERFLFGRAAFAFEIAAGKFADRGRLFAVIDRERKPILAFLDFGGGDGADEHHGVAAGNDDGAVGELRDFAGFD